MRQKYKILIFSLLNFSFESFSQQHKKINKIPSFNEILTISLSQSLEAKKATLAKTQATSDRNTLFYNRLPKVSVAASGNISENTKIQMNQIYKAEVNYNLYDFGKKSAQEKVSDLNIENKSLEIEEIDENLSWQLARDYLDLVFAQKAYLIARKNREISKARLMATEKNYKMGLRPENDYVAAQVDFGSTDLNYIKHEDGFRYQIKKNFLNMGNTIEVEDISNLTDIPSFMERSPEDWEQQITSWSEKRATLAQQKRELEKQRILIQKDLLFADKMPSFDISLGTQWSHETGKNNESSFNGGLSITWNLPWTGQYKEEKEQLSLRARSVYVEDEIENRNKHTKMTLAFDRFQSAKKYWQAIERQLILSKRQYEIIKSRYNTGKASALELSNSELDLGRINLERAQATQDIISSVIDYAYALSIKEIQTIFSKSPNPA